MLKVVAILILTAFPVVASTSDRVVLRDNVSPAHRNELESRLRTITGWKQLTFGEKGVLQTGDAAAENGSKSARDLLNRAISGNRVIVFEDASSHKDVVFCRVVLGKFQHEPVPSVEAYVVFVDFDDFRQVSGDKLARAAFDVGWAALHEIDHVVEDSQDPEHGMSAGDCETHINKMRRELGLPIRNGYFFTVLPTRNDPNFKSRLVRLGFDHVNSTAAKTKRYWLIWDAAVVGGVSEDCATAKSGPTTNVRSLAASTSRSF